MTGRQPSRNSIAPGESGELRSFGRRRGRKPSTRQAALLRDALPGVALDLGAAGPPPHLSQLFPETVTDVWLEIGFGGGEHLLWQAAHNPGVGMIGCEPFQDGVLKVLDAIAAGGYSNIRLLADDARPLLRWLPPTSVSRAFILFPDPWPKSRHRKRRLINVHFLEALARVMRAGAELRVAFDVGDYVRTALQAIRDQGAFRWSAKSACDWRERGADWPPTRYEAKAIAAVRRCYYLRFHRR